jgi:hypothetical protein
MAVPQLVDRSGSIRQPGATRLYFGFGDAWSFQGPPGFYADNSGSVKVAARFH